ncbi:CBO0543 family protein [Mesobacillus foraminis]|nr:CBO0543 family protein [Mesobacillus foraminis]
MKDLDEEGNIYHFLGDSSDKRSVRVICMRILLSLILVISCWKLGDIKNWRTYYPTILYVIINNLLYSFFVSEKKYFLWKLEPDFLLNPTFSFLVQNFIIFPCLIILFLSYLPKYQHKKITYIILAASILAGIEFIMYLTGRITYHHGWNFWWSIGFNILWVLMMKLHFYKPIPAWVVSFIITAFFIIYFHVPLPE